MVNVDGTDVVNLTNNGQNNYAPAVSPDGSLIAFESVVDGNAEVFVMNLRWLPAKESHQLPRA